VVEVMRPLPLEPVIGLPTFILGLSVIRGAPVPVVDLAALTGDRRGSGTTRFVTLGLGERRVAVAVEEVLGVRALDVETLQELPPLLLRPPTPSKRWSDRFPTFSSATSECPGRMATRS
jgi:purine-binding chemotaxis protein CheW